MPYDHQNQFRAPIVRGKALSDLDNLLPLYSNIIQQITPCSLEDFEKQFNENLKKYLTAVDEKTLNNHRTEIAGKLFGLYYLSVRNNEILLSSRAEKLLLDGDQPAFFKDLCLKYQFPTGMNKSNVYLKHIKQEINVRQLAFFVSCVHELEKQDLKITKKQAGYYIFNSLDVLTLSAKVGDVVDQISHDLQCQINREIQGPKPSSYKMQHVNEQINLLVLANVVSINEEYLISLNRSESLYINEIIKVAETPPDFDFSSYDLTTIEGRKNCSHEWDIFMAEKSNLSSETLSTSLDSIGLDASHLTNADIGKEGEEYVYNFERNRVQRTFPRLVNKIKKVGHIKGLGYDVHSISAEGLAPDSPKLIEVKSTKRVTASEADFYDSVTFTRSEYVAAMEYKNNFFIYRVYFTKQGVRLFIINDLAGKQKEQLVSIVPTQYRVEFNQNSGQFIDVEA